MPPLSGSGTVLSATEQGQAVAAPIFRAFSPVFQDIINGTPLAVTLFVEHDPPAGPSTIARAARGIHAESWYRLISAGYFDVMGDADRGRPRDRRTRGRTGGRRQRDVRENVFRGRRSTRPSHPLPMRQAE